MATPPALVTESELKKLQPGIGTLTEGYPFNTGADRGGLGGLVPPF